MAATLLLTRRAREAVSFGSPAFRAQRLRFALVGGIALVRSNSIEASVDRIREELDLLDVDPPINRIERNTLTELARARRVAEKMGQRFEEKATADGVEAAVEIVDKQVPRIAVTDSSQAFNEARLDYLRDLPEADLLFRRWDAEIDACPVCREADGEIVGVNDSFLLGEPGSVHPNCQCTFEILTEAEARAA